MTRLELGRLELWAGVADVVNHTDLWNAIRRQESGEFGTLADSKDSMMATCIKSSHKDRNGVVFQIFTATDSGERQTHVSVAQESWDLVLEHTRRDLDSKRPFY